MSLYGYRYKAGGHVFELRGTDYDMAAAAVADRRHQQGRNGTPPTAELVEFVDGEWQAVTR